MNETVLPTNRLAIISLVVAVLTFFSFCIGVLPPPGTGWVCFPAAIILGAVALISGMIALGQIRASGEQGRGLALIGAWTGGLTILATLCAIVLAASALVIFIDQLWKQFHP